MKGWVFGIVGVFCLQAGFIALTAIDRPFETMVAVNEVTSGAHPVADTIGFADADEFTVYESEPGTDELLGESISFSTPATRKVKRVRTVQRARKRFVKTPQAQPVNFEPVIIAVRKHPPIKFKTEYARFEPVPRVSDPKEESVHARPVSKPAKKSFASKSIAVLKKPYDWLKALGSKFK